MEEEENEEEEEETPTSEALLQQPQAPSTNPLSSNSVKVLKVVLKNYADKIPAGAKVLASNTSEPSNEELPSIPSGLPSDPNEAGVIDIDDDDEDSGDDYDPEGEEARQTLQDDTADELLRRRRSSPRKRSKAARSPKKQSSMSRLFRRREEAKRDDETLDSRVRSRELRLLEECLGRVRGQTKVADWIVQSDFKKYSKKMNLRVDYSS